MEKTLIFKRKNYNRIIQNFHKGKVIIIYGPRQSGKTTLCKEILKQYEGVYFSCDNPAVAQSFTPKSAQELRAYLGEGNLFILDEAQRVENIGLTLKIIVDNYPNIQIIATGSSSFELANTVNEPLTGRNIKYYLLPPSQKELSDSFHRSELRDNIANRLIYGSYPEIISNPERAKEQIIEIAGDYLFRDLLNYEGIRKPDLVLKLLRLLALQVGGEVSYLKLAKELSVNSTTIETYVKLLEQAFIIFTLPSLWTNKYTEVTKLKKIYFYDNGIRNSLVDNFQDISLRQDQGILLENFFISEKIKEKLYTSDTYKSYFWRTKSGQEIDYVEEYQSGQSYKIWECKTTKSASKTPPFWLKNYEDQQLQVVTIENIVDELLK